MEVGSGGGVIDHGRGDFHGVEVGSVGGVIDHGRGDLGDSLSHDVEVGSDLGRRVDTIGGLSRTKYDKNVG